MVDEARHPQFSSIRLSGRKVKQFRKTGGEFCPAVGLALKQLYFPMKMFVLVPANQKPQGFCSGDPRLFQQGPGPNQKLKSVILPKLAWPLKTEGEEEGKGEGGEGGGGGGGGAPCEW